MRSAWTANGPIGPSSSSRRRLTETTPAPRSRPRSPPPAGGFPHARTARPAAFSLRDLARRAGVSRAAPAQHFRDRTGPLTAIAAEGFGLLAAATRASADLKEAGVRYVLFAREHPAHFQVMFTPSLLRADDLELTTARALSADALRTVVAQARHTAEGTENTEDARGAQDARLTGIASWSVAHGFATLPLRRNLDDLVGDRAPEEVFETLTGLLFRPLRPPREGTPQEAPRTPPTSRTPPPTPAVPARPTACRRPSRSSGGAPAPGGPPA